MSDEIKILGQVNPPANTTATLYTTPDLTQTTVSSLVVCNFGSNQGHFRVSVHAGGEAADNKQWLFHTDNLANHTTRTVVIGICLNQTDVIKVYADNSNFAFNLFGVETI